MAEIEDLTYFFTHCLYKYSIVFWSSVLVVQGSFVAVYWLKYGSRGFGSQHGSDPCDFERLWVYCECRGS